MTVVTVWSFQFFHEKLSLICKSHGNIRFLCKTDFLSFLYKWWISHWVTNRPRLLFSQNIYPGINDRTWFIRNWTSFTEKSVKFMKLSTQNSFLEFAPGARRARGAPGARGARGSGVSKCCSDPPFHTRRGSGWRELNKLPQITECRTSYDTKHGIILHTIFGTIYDTK